MPVQRIGSKVLVVSLFVFLVSAVVLFIASELGHESALLTRAYRITNLCLTTLFFVAVVRSEKI